MSDRKRCSEKVPGSGGWRWYQCKRYEWKDGFCKQHHPDTKAERDSKAREAFEKRVAESPFRLKAQIIELEQQLSTLRRAAKKSMKGCVRCRGKVKFIGKDFEELVCNYCEDLTAAIKGQDS